MVNTPSIATFVAIVKAEVPIYQEPAVVYASREFLSELFKSNSIEKGIKIVTYEFH